MTFTARYYDGITAEPYDALVSVNEYSLVIECVTPPKHLEWPYADVHIIDKPEHGRPLRINNIHQPNSRLIISDNSLYDVLIKRVPHANAPAIAISVSTKSLALWTIPAVLAVIMLYWIVPRLTLPIAEHFPASWDKSIGEYTIEVFTGDSPICKNPQGQAALDKMVGLLATSAESKPQVNARVIKENHINAFAVPGGQVVIFSKLIDMAKTPDELSGIIAHEMGHVIRRHPTQMLIRNLGLNLIIKMMFAGPGSTGMTADLANELYQMHYSQNFEREADAIATQTLYNAGIDHQGFVNFFTRLKAQEKGTDNAMFSYVSTHPPTEERIEAIEGTKNVLLTKPILSDTEWKALKNICH